MTSNPSVYLCGTISVMEYVKRQVEPFLKPHPLKVVACGNDDIKAGALMLHNGNL